MSSKWSTNPFLDLKDEEKRPDWIAKNTHDSTLFVSTAQFLEQDSLGRMVYGEKKGESAWRVRVLNGTKHVLFAYNPEEPLEAAMIPVSTVPTDSDASVAQATDGKSESSTPAKLTLREMLKMSLDNQANRLGLPGMCWFTLDKIDTVLSAGGKDLRHYTMLDSARYQAVANAGKDTTLYNKLVLYADNCNGDPMYFGVVDTTGAVAYVYQNHFEKSKDGSGPKDGTTGDSAPVADNTGEKSSDGGATPKGASGTTDTTKAGASADSSATASKSKSAAADTLGSFFRHENIERTDGLMSFDPNHTPNLFDPNPRTGYMLYSDGTRVLTGSKWIKQEGRLARMMVRRGSIGFDNLYLGDYAGGGYASPYIPYNNYGLMTGGCCQNVCQNVYQQNYWVPRGHWSGYNNQMYPNMVCEGPLWMHPPGCIHNGYACGQPAYAYNDYSGWNISAGAGVTIGGSIGGDYRNVAADGSNVTRTPMVIRIDTEGMKQEVAAAAKKAEVDTKNLASAKAKAKADMRAELRAAVIKQQVADKVRAEAVAVQQQMRDEIRAEVANIERVRQETATREDMRNEVSAAITREVSREVASKKTPVTMNSVRPTPVTTKPVTSAAPVSSGLQNVRPVQAQAQAQTNGKGDRVRGNAFTASSKGDRGNHTSSTFETPRVNNTTRPVQQPMQGSRPNTQVKGDVYQARPQAVQQPMMTTHPQVVPQRPTVVQQSPTMTRPQVQQHPVAQPPQARPRVQMTRTAAPTGKRR